MTDIGLCGSTEFDMTVANKCNNTFNVINFEMTKIRFCFLFTLVPLTSCFTFVHEKYEIIKKKHILVARRSKRSQISCVLPAVLNAASPVCDYKVQRRDPINAGSRVSSRAHSSAHIYLLARNAVQPSAEQVPTCVYFVAFTLADANEHVCTPAARHFCVMKRCCPLANCASHP